MNWPHENNVISILLPKLKEAYSQISNLDAYCLCIDLILVCKSLLKILLVLFELQIQKEKPVAWKASDIDIYFKHKNSNKIFVAYHKSFIDNDHLCNEISVMKVITFLLILKISPFLF